MTLFSRFIAWINGPKPVPKPVPQPTPHYSFLDNPRCMVVDLTQADIDYFNSLRDWR